MLLATARYEFANDFDAGREYLRVQLSTTTENNFFIKNIGFSNASFDGL